MKILIVTDAWLPQVNGVVRTLGQTRDQLIAMGHEVHFITPQQFKTFPCPTYPEIRLAWRPMATMRKRIEDIDPDCLHIATEGPLGWAARKVALQTRRPFTTAYHTRFPEYVHARFKIPLAISYAVLRWFHRPSSRIMAPSPSIIQTLSERGFSNVMLWSRGVDLQKFSLQRAPSGHIGPMNEAQVMVPAGLHMPPALSAQRPIFLYAGRVAVEKNIEAFLHLDLPGSKWVAGDGPESPRLKALYPDVHWFGMLNTEQLAHVYHHADVFVFPSKTDTFGLVMLEAMACGLPVAAYPVTGPVDVVTTDTGMRPGALDKDLRAACIAALTVPKERARQHAQHFTWEAATRQFLSYLQPITKPAPIMLGYNNQFSGAKEHGIPGR